MNASTSQVTGATAGVGLETAARLARMGATVLVAGRDAARTAAAVDSINKRCGRDGAARGIPLDLCSLESVRACAAAAPRLDILILNAGTNANLPTPTHPDMDCSLVFGVNFVAQWLLCTLLHPKLAEDARVVCLSSVAHHHAVDVSGASADYGESKLAMLLFARALARGDLGGRRVDAVAVNPGAVASDIWRHVWRPFRGALAGVAALLFLTPDQASAPSVAAAAAPLSVDADGLPAYLSPYWTPSPGSPVPGKSAFEFLGVFVGAAPAYARVPRDEAAVAAALWARCEALVGGGASPRGR